MKAAKIIATCFKSKEIIEKTRLTGDPLGYFYHSQNFTNTNDIINLLKKHIDLENKFDPGFKRDLIIVNADIGSDKGNKFIEEINNKKINGGKIISYTRNNYGLSYGSYNDAFLKFKNDYEYFLFTEDDWLIINDNYLKVGIDILNSDKKYGMIPYVNVTKIHKSHWKNLNLNKKNAIGCHGGVGLSSTKILNMVVEQYGCLPHNKDDDYTKSVANGEIKFPNSIVKLGYKLVNLPKEHLFCIPAYDYIRNIKYKKFPNFIDLLRDYYFQILKRKVGKAIWNFVSINNFLKHMYLRFINFIKQKK